MSENEWNYKPSDAVQEVLKQLNEIRVSTSALAMSQAWKNAVPKFELSGTYAALREIVASRNEWQKTVLQIKSVSVMMAEMYPSYAAEISTMVKSVAEQIDTSALTSLRESFSAAVSAQTDWSWLAEAYTSAAETVKDEETADTVAKTPVTEEIRSEMAEDITQILSDPEKMHLASRSKYLQWKERNPGFAAFFLDILFPILLLLAGWGFSSWQARTTKDARVYEEPSATSSIVYNITIENNVTVIGDAPYYYEVEFPNSETGEMIRGYISKRNLTADVTENAEVQEDETEATEVLETTVAATEPQADVSE